MLSLSIPSQFCLFKDYKVRTSQADYQNNNLCYPDFSLFKNFYSHKYTREMEKEKEEKQIENESEKTKKTKKKPTQIQLSVL